MASGIKIQPLTNTYCIETEEVKVKPKKSKKVFKQISLNPSGNVSKHVGLYIFFLFIRIYIKN